MVQPWASFKMTIFSELFVLSNVLSLGISNWKCIFQIVQVDFIKGFFKVYVKYSEMFILEEDILRIVFSIFD